MERWRPTEYIQQHVVGQWEDISSASLKVASITDTVISVIYHIGREANRRDVMFDDNFSINGTANVVISFDVQKFLAQMEAQALILPLKTKRTL